MKFFKEKGQIGMGQLLAIAGAIIVATITGWFGQSGRTDSKLEDFKAKVAEDKTEYVKQTATISTKLDNLIVVVDKLDKRIK